MRDRCPERPLSGHLRVDVDPLVVVRRLGEEIDLLLVDGLPVARPELELVGLWVHSADKAGKDAGDIAGIEPLGVMATNDADALLALDADCVCYTATADLRPTEAIADMARKADKAVQARLHRT